jgi:hypothetical protein
MLVILFALNMNLITLDNEQLFDRQAWDRVYYDISKSDHQYGTINFDVEAVLWKTFFIGGDVKTLVEYPAEGTDHDFDPKGMDYKFRTGFRFFDGNLEIGFLHECDHPIYTWLTDGMRNTVQSYERANEQVYIQIKSKLELN